MSYKRHFSKDFNIPLNIRISDPSVHTDNEGKLSGISSGSIHVDYNGHTFKYSIGGHGDSESHDLGHYETVDVDIEVDTKPFDGSISDCNNHVNVLTGSVAATKTAQVASVAENSKKIATTIITGFFKNVQADISSKIVELAQRVDSRLLHLNEQAKTLQAKRQQMEDDYQRTKARYSKIVMDLNKELENRVKALDEPIFKMVSVVEGESKRMVNADFAEIASIVAKENTALSTQIGAAMTKKRAKQAISKAVEFLRIQKLTNIAIDRSTISGLTGENGSYYLPVCYFETKDANGTVQHDCAYDKEHLPSSVTDKIEDSIFSNPEMVLSMHEVERENVEKFFNASIQDAMKGTTDPHDIRVINTISKLFFE